MKTNKYVTITTIILLTAIIITASFLGIYKLKDYKVVNIVPKFILGMEFKDKRVVNFEVDTSIKNVEIYDEEGNLVTEQKEGTEYTEENGYKIVENKANNEEVLNKKNYEKAEKIIRNRLDNAKVGEYIIRKDNNGNMQVELSEQDDIDKIVSMLSTRGEFTVADEETGEILLDNSNIKNAKIAYAQNTTGTTVYMQIEFDKEGMEKLKEISKKYIATTIQEENDDGELEDITTTKNIEILIDRQTYVKTYFGEEIPNGVLNLTVGTGTDMDTVNEYINNATILSNIINAGINPIEYTITQETNSSYENINCWYNAIFVSIGILIVALIYLVIKFKVSGVFGAIMQIGYIALLLLVLRYVNITLTVSGIIGIVVSILLSYVMIYIILKDDKKIKKFAISSIPQYILVILLSFSQYTEFSSIAMVLLWGNILMYAYHLICTKTIINLLNK